MGGMEFRLPVASWPQTPGINWLLPGEWNVQRDDARSFELAGLAFSDLLASVDAVVTKPGYGTFVEAACSGIPILYLERDDWPERLLRRMARHQRPCPRADARAIDGRDFIEELRQLRQRPAVRQSALGQRCQPGG